MRRLIVLLLLLVVSVWIGMEAVQHPGYVFIAYEPWLIQIPLWFGFLATLFIFGLLYVLINSVERIQFAWFRFTNWMRFRREHKLFNKTQYGLSLLIEENWYKAEKMLLAGIDSSIDPLMNYLGAAKAAHAQGAYDRRDKYIRQAHMAAPQADLAIGLTQAELQINQNQMEEALAVLTRLRKKAPYHARILRMLEQVYSRLGDWESLQKLLPIMRKSKVLSAEQIQQFEKNLYCERLRHANFTDKKALSQFWAAVPRAMRLEPDVVHEYVIWLQRFSETHAIEDAIQRVLKTTWNARLVKTYASLTFDNLNKQLVILGGWLNLHGPHAELLLALGNICAKVQLWGKAKDYYERCLALGPNSEASLAYAKLLQTLGEEEAAVQQYRQGLAQAANA